MYSTRGSKDEQNPDGKYLCFAGEPRMPVDFYMLFASPRKGNAIDACCACGKGKDFGQKAWKYARACSASAPELTGHGGCESRAPEPGPNRAPALLRGTRADQECDFRT